MIPKTPEEMTATMKELMVYKLYTAVTIAARQKRLTEHDIALIERSTLRDFDIGDKVAHEFTSFEAEPAIKKAIAIVQELVDHARTERVNQVNKS